MTDERIIAYLLKELPDEEAERFEDECFALEDWPSLLDSVEEDLVDDYLRRDLSPERRRLFESNYLTTAARRERVRLAAAFLHHLDGRREAVAEDTGQPAAVQPAAVRSDGPTWVERLRAAWGGRAWALRPVAAALALAVFAAGAWWLYNARTAPPQTLALVLTAGDGDRAEGARAGSAELTGDTDALSVRMMLPDATTPAARYRVTLESEDEKTEPLEVAGQDARSVSVLIPAARLARGRYVLRLSAVDAGGSARRVGNYFFNIL